MSDLLTYCANIPQLIAEVLTVVKDGKTVAELYPKLVSHFITEDNKDGINVTIPKVPTAYGPNGHSVAMLRTHEEKDEDDNVIGFFSYLPSLEIIGRGKNAECYYDCFSRPEDKAKYLLAVPFRVTADPETGEETTATEPHIHCVING